MKSAITMLVGLTLGLGVSPDGPGGAARKSAEAGDQQSGVVTAAAQLRNRVATSMKSIVLVKIPGGGHGSGVIIDARRRLILTNAHVVQMHKTVTIHLRDGSTVPARVLRRAGNGLDLALVQYDPIVQMNGARPVERTLPQVTIACRMAEAPERVTAIGHPGPIRWAVSHGYVSASGFARFKPLGRSLVLDLTIWHGNSGGGLFDAKGRLIGIVSAIFVQRRGFSRSYSGFSFAISGPDMCMFLGKGQTPNPPELAQN